MCFSPWTWLVTAVGVLLLGAALCGVAAAHCRLRRAQDRTRRCAVRGAQRLDMSLWFSLGALLAQSTCWTIAHSRAVKVVESFASH